MDSAPFHVSQDQAFIQTVLLGMPAFSCSSAPDMFQDPDDVGTFDGDAALASYLDCQDLSADYYFASVAPAPSGAQATHELHPGLDQEDPDSLPSWQYVLCKIQSDPFSLVDLSAAQQEQPQQYEEQHQPYQATPYATLWEQHEQQQQQQRHEQQQQRHEQQQQQHEQQQQQHEHQQQQHEHHRHRKPLYDLPVVSHQLGEKYSVVPAAFREVWRDVEPQEMALFQHNVHSFNKETAMCPPLSQFLIHRSPTLEQLSSPEARSPMSDQGRFDTQDEEICYSPVSTVQPIESIALDRIGASSFRSRAAVVAPIEQLFLPSPKMAVEAAAPTLSSPSRPQYICLSDCEPEVVQGPLKRKRVRHTKSTATKNKTPPVKLPCPYQDCQVSCSSYPSLARHTESHKWRGKYVPVRCESCQSALSNEFSVQRHILRSQVTSRCYRMRIYSVMRSETEVETTLRFYPKRPHGKKTVEVDLVQVRANYFASNAE